MIPDEDFIIKKDVPGPTKEEIRCLVMCKSKVSEDDIVVDVGCGTGGLTVEFAKKAKMVYAVDKNSDALELTEKNLKKHELRKKVELIEGEALAVLDRIPNFDVLMVGGSSGNLPSIIKKGYEKLKDNGRIVITAILLETRFEAIKNMQDLGMVPDVAEVSISKGKFIDRGTMMLSRNPVAIISARK